MPPQRRFTGFYAARLKDAKIEHRKEHGRNSHMSKEAQERFHARAKKAWECKKRDSQSQPCKKAYGQVGLTCDGTVRRSKTKEEPCDTKHEKKHKTKSHHHRRHRKHHHHRRSSNNNSCSRRHQQRRRSSSSSSSSDDDESFASQMRRFSSDLFIHNLPWSGDAVADDSDDDDVAQTPFKSHAEKISAREIHITMKDRDGVLVTDKAAVKLLKKNKQFRTELTLAILDTKFDRVFFEMKPLLRGVEDTFIVAVVNAAGKLTDQADLDAFPGKLTKAVNTFPGLDSALTLVAPGKPPTGETYAHLMQFLLNAPPPVIDIFWHTVASHIPGLLSLHGKVYVSTHGKGVAWLHMRLEPTPKHYVSRLKSMYL